MTVHAARRELQYLVDAWPIIVELKIPGPARSWVERPRRTGVITPEDLDRMGPQGVPRPAPADVSVLDLLSRISTVADNVLRTIHVVLGLVDGRHVPARSAWIDARPWLSEAKSWLAQAQEDNDKTVPWVLAQLAPLTATTARLLGDVREGQVINAVCPWCGGRAEGGLVGERTMSLRYPDHRDEEEGDVPEDPLIVCRGLACEPPAASCGTRWQEHPAWPRREWDWLASQLQVAALA